jgi:hypothetical protein
LFPVFQHPIKVRIRCRPLAGRHTSARQRTTYRAKAEASASIASSIYVKGKTPGAGG